MAGSLRFRQTTIFAALCGEPPARALAVDTSHGLTSDLQRAEGWRAWPVARSSMKGGDSAESAPRDTRSCRGAAIDFTGWWWGPLWLGAAKRKGQSPTDCQSEVRPVSRPPKRSGGT